MIGKSGIITAKSKKKVEQLIAWLEHKTYPVEGIIPTPAQYAWRMGNNKAIEDIIALLKYTGDYQENTIEELLAYLGEEYKVSEPVKDKSIHGDTLFEM